MSTRILLVSALAVLAGACGAPEAPASWYPDEPVAEARLFAPGVISTERAREYGAAFLPDAQTVYFTRRESGQRERIWEVRFADGLWQRPVRASFSAGRDRTPWITAEGDRIYFSSGRDGVVDVSDDELDIRRDHLWYADRNADGWSPPRPVPGGVNEITSGTDPEEAGPLVSPVVAPDGSLFYWSERRVRDEGPDLYRAVPLAEGFGPGELLPEPLNSPGVESNLVVTADGLLIFQGFGRNDGYGMDDLFYSQWQGDRWTEPTALPPAVNSPANEGWPALTPDDRYLLFSSDRSGVLSIYFVELDALDLDLVEYDGSSVGGEPSSTPDSEAP